MSDPEELERVAEKVVELTQAHDYQHGPYLVSKLGIDLGEDLRRLKVLTNRGLREFIQSHLSGRVTLVQTGIHRNISAIIPGSVEPSTIDTLYSHGKQKKRFQFRFWAAFSVPLEKDVRVINMEDFKFEDVVQAEVPEGGVTINREFIAPAEAENRDALIKINIARWLAIKELPEERFLVHGNLKQSIAAFAFQESNSLLAAMIEALDHKQLQSTSLPLDVVATLLRTQRS